MVNKVLVVLSVLIVVSLFLIRVPTNEEFLTLKYFDKEGNEVIKPLSIVTNEIEFMKMYLNVKNDEIYPIKCKILSVSPIVDFSDEIQEIQIEESAIFETGLIPKEKIGNMFTGRIGCYYEQNGQRINLPEQSGGLQL